MSKFWQVNEDPFYDEDGQLIDEDADWEEIKDLQIEDDSYDPYETVNS